MDKTPHLSENTPPDRRTQRTRQTLSHALIALIQEKRYDAITVQDICDRANVGRSTFYAHYQDKDDLLASNFQQMMESLGSRLNGETANSSFRSRRCSSTSRNIIICTRRCSGAAAFDVLLRAGQQQWRAQIEQYLTSVAAAGPPSGCSVRRGHCLSGRCLADDAVVVARSQNALLAGAHGRDVSAVGHARRECRLLRVASRRETGGQCSSVSGDIGTAVQA